MGSHADFDTMAYHAIERSDGGYQDRRRARGLNPISPPQPDVRAPLGYPVAPEIIYDETFALGCS